MPSRRAERSFQGFPPEAFRFFGQLAKNNDRDWFQAHKDTYERSVREPMKLLVEDLARGAESKISRINKDMRFARDESPYRTYIGAGFDGNYVSLSAAGVFVGAGLYRPDGPALERYREAVEDDESGRALQKIVSTLERKDYMVSAHERLARAPRGYAPDHPRVELLKMKGIYAGKTFPPSAKMSSPTALKSIATVVKDVRPLVEWIRAHVGARDH